jgi:hypothetical protein
MGGEQSKKRDEMIKIVEGYTCEKEAIVSEREFVEIIFEGLDNAQGHTDAGPLIVSDTHVLKAFYTYLAAVVNHFKIRTKVQCPSLVSNKSSTKFTLNHRNRLNVRIPNSDSYRSIIQGKTDRSITRKEFVDYVTQCYDRGVNSVLKHTSDNLLKSSLLQWMMTNR